MREFFSVSHTSDFCVWSMWCLSMTFPFSLFPLQSNGRDVDPYLQFFHGRPGPVYLQWKHCLFPHSYIFFHQRKQTQIFSAVVWWIFTRPSFDTAAMGAAAETDGYIHVSETAAVGTWHHISCSYEQRTDDDDVDAPLVCATFFFHPLVAISSLFSSFGSRLSTAVCAKLSRRRVKNNLNTSFKRHFRASHPKPLPTEPQR